MTLGEKGDWDGLVVVASGERWGDQWGSHRHMAEAVARRRPVLYVDVPASPLGRLRGETHQRWGLRVERPGMAVTLPPALPGLTRPGIRQSTSALTRRAIRQALAELGGPRVEAIVMCSLSDLVGACAAAALIMYVTDDFVAMGDLVGPSRSWREKAERKLGQQADRIVAVSDHLAATLATRGLDAVVIPNGCDPNAFATVDEAPMPGDVDLPAPLAGMVGRLSSRIDLQLLEAVADTGTGLLLVGPRDHDAPAGLDALLRRQNVSWVGPKPFSELPSYLRCIDVGLTPYADLEFNRASWPLKALEYLAAGRASVASDLPATRAMVADGVEVARTPREFAELTTAALARPRTPDVVKRRRAAARRNSWGARADQLLALIDDVGRANQVNTT